MPLGGYTGAYKNSNSNTNNNEDQDDTYCAIVCGKAVERLYLDYLNEFWPVPGGLLLVGQAAKSTFELL